MKVRESLKTSGIYCIYNTVNGKIYIGSSVNIYNRISKHKSELLKNRHANCILQNSFNKHDNSSFYCIIIEIVSNFNNLTTREQFWINLLNPEYNITTEVIRNTLSEKSRLKISNTLKRKYRNGSIKPTRTTKVNLYSSGGDFLKAFDTQRECAKYINVNYKSLTDVLSKKYKQINGFQIRYNTGNTDNIDPIDKTRKKIVQKIASKFAPIDVYYENGIFFNTYYKQRDCAKELNVSISSIQKVLNKKKSSVKGFIIKRSNISKEEYLQKINGKEPFSEVTH